MPFIILRIVFSCRGDTADLAPSQQQEPRAPPDMCGWLQKYNSFPAMLAAPWERNWFRLDGPLLSQYRTDTDAHPLGSLNVQACCWCLQCFTDNPRNEADPCN